MSAAAALEDKIAAPEPIRLETTAAEPASGFKAHASAPTDRTIVFVLGGPGAGKGTQCQRLSSALPVAHFSAGDLLRAHVQSGSEEGQMVADMIRNGQIVPAEVTIRLLESAMQDKMKKAGINKFLIDGFPRNIDNQESFEKILGIDCTFVMVFNCSEEEMERRIFGRNQGRTDDNAETLRKRFKVFKEQTMPVI